MPSVVQKGMVTPLFKFIRNFFVREYDAIVADLTGTVARLEALAKRKEQELVAHVEQQHLSKKLADEAQAVMEKARATAANIGKLFG